MAPLKLTDLLLWLIIALSRMLAKLTKCNSSFHARTECARIATLDLFCFCSRYRLCRFHLCPIGSACVVLPKRFLRGGALTLCAKLGTCRKRRLLQCLLDLRNLVPYRRHNRSWKTYFRLVLLYGDYYGASL